jgi:hypothetical protein
VYRSDAVTLAPRHRSLAEQPPAAPRGPQRLGRLVRGLADSLVLDPVAEPEVGPYVYTAAIHTKADLVSSLVGIACLARELGFQLHPETCYADDGLSASWHAGHDEWPLSLSVDCHARRQTVAIALSGFDHDLTFTWFQRVEASLFGPC